MKDYQQVVKERFDQEDTTRTSMYDPDQPIGKYSRKVIFTALSRTIEHSIGNRESLKELRVLDVGCGSGEMLNFLIDQGFPPDQAAGVDFSSKRIEKAQKKYPAMEFKQADITQPLPFETHFDLVSAFDLFSHLTTEEQLLEGLRNVHHVLDDGGFFLWYDIASKDHFEPSPNADSWGFSKAQMLSLAQQTGFEYLSYQSTFRNFFNRYHSLYQAKRIPHGLLGFLEKIIPGRPGNHIFIFYKK